MGDATLNLNLANREGTLRPDTLRLKDLYAVAKLVEDAILAAAPLDDSDSPFVTLTGIREGSAALRLTLAAVVRTAAAGIMTSAAQARYDDIPYQAHVKLAELSRYLAHKGWSAEFTGAVAGSLRISDDNPIPAPRRRTVRERTTVYGRCVRVGGDAPKVRLRLAKTERKILDVEVDAALAARLGERLYDDVGLVGVAVRDARTLAILSFRAEELTAYRGKAADPATALDRLAELARAAQTAGHWVPGDGGDDE